MTATSFQTSWAESVLKGLGAPVTSGNVQALVEWQAAEGGSQTNPLNTTLGQGGAQGSAIKGYGSVQAGIDATVQTLLGTPGYAAVVKAFKTNAGPGSIGGAVIQSPWDGSNHYAGTDYLKKVTGEVLAPNTLPSELATGGVNAVGQGFNDIGSALTSIPDAIKWVSTNWLRILEFIGGVILGIAGLVLLGRAVREAT